MPPRNFKKNRFKIEKRILQPPLKTLILGAGIFLLIGASLVYFFFMRSENTNPQPETSKTQAAPPAEQPLVQETEQPGEKQPEEPTPDPIPTPPPTEAPPKSFAVLHQRPDNDHGTETPTPKSNRPRVAIIIDDIGNNQNVDNEFINLDLPLSFAFLPEGAYNRELAGKAKARGADILLHLPMEPDDPKWDLGPGGLRVSMTREQISSIFTRDLAAVPGAVGVNNHMGSKFTENRAAMEAVLNMTRRNNLFFVDSVTASGSVGYETARWLGIKSGRRNVFLDNVQEKEAVRLALEELVRQATRNGQAIAIGHPHPSTLAALREAGPILRKKVDLVGVHNLVQ